MTPARVPLKDLAAGAPGALRRGWARLRAWRRIRITSGGLVFTGGAFAVGFAAVNTGNNLLYLLLGAMLGFILVSGWVSERAIRDLAVEREVPRGVTAGQPAPVSYRVHKAGGRLPALALEISEAALPQAAFLAAVAPGGEATTRAFNTFPRRGAYPLSTVTLSTGFPFGLFVKSRNVVLPGLLVVWPRTDRFVRPLTRTGGHTRAGESPARRGGHPSRGEYRALHEYRPGDDARDIHWRTSARLRAPVVREYEAEASEDLWICLDTRGPAGDGAERLVEIAASLAALASREARSFGLTAGAASLPPGSGAGHLEAALDLLARVAFGSGAPVPRPPEPGARCVLLTRGASEQGLFDEVYREDAA